MGLASPACHLRVFPDFITCGLFLLEVGLPEVVLPSPEAEALALTCHQVYAASSMKHQQHSLVALLTRAWLPITACLMVPRALGMLLQALKRLPRINRDRQKRKQDREQAQALAGQGPPEPLRVVRARCEAAWLLDELQEALAHGSPSTMLRVQHMLEVGFGAAQGPEQLQRWAQQAWALHSWAAPLDGALSDYQAEHLDRASGPHREQQHATPQEAPLAAERAVSDNPGMALEAGRAALDSPAAITVQLLETSRSGCAGGAGSHPQPGPHWPAAGNQVQATSLPTYSPECIDDVAWWEAEQAWSSDHEPPPDDPDDTDTDDI